MMESDLPTAKLFFGMPESPGNPDIGIISGWFGRTSGKLRDDSRDKPWHL
jgi:hypothetical protein